MDYFVYLYLLSIDVPFSLPFRIILSFVSIFLLLLYRHYKLSLDKAVLNNDRIVCNYHGACFDTATGDIEDGPSWDRIPVYPVTFNDQDKQYYVDIPETGDLSLPMVPHMCPTESTDPRNFVIIGAGPAGQACAETLRQEGYTGKITMLTREAVAEPYDRIKLSKDMSVPHTKIALRSSEFYRNNGIAIRTNTTVKGVSTNDKVLTLDSGETIKYDKLLCATGGPPRLLPGAEKFSNIFPLRDVSHSAGIHQALTTIVKPHVVIIGSSFIGMEAATYIISNTDNFASVTVVGMENVPFERVLGPQVGKLMLRLYESKNVKFYMKSTLYTGPEGGFNSKSTGTKPPVSRVTIVPFVPGPPQPMTSLPKEAVHLDADIVIIGAGIIPATEYLKNSSDIKLHPGPGPKFTGVTVDEYLCAGPEDVFAAGDIAVFPFPYSTDPDTKEVRIEHWDVAIDHGRIAARNMLGQRKPYMSVPFFWTNQLGRPIRSAGYCYRIDDAIIHGDLEAANPAKAEAVIYYVTNKKVSAVLSVGLADNTAVAAMELFRLNAMPSPDDLKANTSLNLADYLAQYTLKIADQETTTSSTNAGSSSSGSRKKTPVRARK